MKIDAIKCPDCKDVIFSRAQHDFRWCSCMSVGADGGFDYRRVAYKRAAPESVEIIVEATKEDLYNDWDNGADKYGIIHPPASLAN